MKFGRKQQIGIGITVAGFAVSTILLGAGRIDGQQWCDFNSSFLPWMAGLMFGGAAVSTLRREGVSL